MQVLLDYFPTISAVQKDQFEQLETLYRHWNDQINVISRKDIEHLYVRHVLHSLSLNKLIRLAEGTHILDLGTGGGFPGIPLAISNPQVQFHCVDGRGKKIKVVKEVAKELGLENLSADHLRAEDIKKRKYDFVVSRAVAPMEKLLQWSRKLISHEHRHGLPNGLFALKGGNLKEELGSIKQEYYEKYPISDWFEEEFFKEKYIIYVQG